MESPASVKNKFKIKNNTAKKSRNKRLLGGSLIDENNFIIPKKSIFMTETKSIGTI